MKPNRYIKAMEIGLAHEKKGISYFDLLEKLNASMGEKMNVGAEKTFVVWFTENFSSDNFKRNNGDIVSNYVTYIIYRNDETFNTDEINSAKNVERWLKKLHWLDGQAAKQYLDYQELVESRKAATQAKKQSNISIGIAIFALLVSSLLGIYSMGTAPKPPYDVKVIENNAQQKEVEQLKEELYRAEMMLEAYESDSVSGS
jgi:hypothetical protein